MTEKQMEKARKKEIQQALKKQDQEQQVRQTEQERRNNKIRANAKKDELQQKIDAFIDETRDRRKIDSEYDNYVTEQVAIMMELMDQLDKDDNVATAETIIAELTELLWQVHNFTNTAYQKSIKYPPKKQLEELRRQKQIHDVELKLAREAFVDEGGIYTGGNLASEYARRNARAKIDLADQKAAIDDFDD